MEGKANPINAFLNKYKKDIYFKEVVNGINKVKRLNCLQHSVAVKKLGISCRYPGTFLSSIHVIINSQSYKSAILKTIRAGGCNCSRSNFIGSYFAALNGETSIPKSWVNKCIHSKNILIKGQ